MKAKVLKVLKKVIDPETGVDVVTMGMIKSISVSKGIAKIKFSPTTPFCPLIGYLKEKIKKAAESVKGVKKAEVEVVLEKPKF